MDILISCSLLGEACKPGPFLAANIDEFHYLISLVFTEFHTDVTTRTRITITSQALLKMFDENSGNKILIKMNHVVSDTLNKSV